MLKSSHRGENYDAVHNEAVNLVRELLEVPDDFAILFIQGGATLQFAMSALNLLAPSEKAGFLMSGHWANLAMKDARMYGNLYIAWDGTEEGYFRTPRCDEIQVQANTRYLHVTTNETIGGVRLFEWPDVGVPSGLRHVVRLFLKENSLGPD